MKKKHLIHVGCLLALTAVLSCHKDTYPPYVRVNEVNTLVDLPDTLYMDQGEVTYSYPVYIRNGSKPVREIWIWMREQLLDSTPKTLQKNFYTLPPYHLAPFDAEFTETLTFQLAKPTDTIPHFITWTIQLTSNAGASNAVKKELVLVSK